MDQFQFPHPPFSIRDCGIMRCVEKPELIIESAPQDNFLRARCAVCPRVRFNLSSNTLEDKKRLRQMFDIHLRGFHRDQNGQTKDSSQ